MIFNFCNPNFTDEEWIYMITKYLDGFTEIPLSTSEGYDIEDLKFYDGLLGTLLKHTEYISENCPKELNKKFVNSWKYQGKLYRVMHTHYVFNDNPTKPQTIMPEVDYHGMITHWTDDYSFKGLLSTNKIFDDEKYIILEADTKEHIAFDVNKFREKYKCRRMNTEKEREFIFPMYKENITEYRMTIKDFIQMKKEEK